MQYLLYTNVCIAILRGQYGVRAKIIEAGFRNCAISEITIAELFYGASKSGCERHVKEVFDIKQMFQTIPISDSLEKYGLLKSQLERAGKRIDDFDLLIGATAIQHGLILVTHNTKHFNRIPDVSLEDWETV